jgi:V8-like Glu-specific endopeptidase
VFEGFVTEYDGSYDSVWPYDIGLITLQQPIGDSLGWLGYWNYENLGDFQGNLVGYHYDKPAFTMWRSTCGVLAEDVAETHFIHDCDFEIGARGAPIYLYDREAKSRVIVGVNIDGNEEASWALQLYGPIMEWIRELNK